MTIKEQAGFALPNIVIGESGDGTPISVDLRENHLLVAGYAGAGKTVLLGQIADQVEAAGGSVIRLGSETSDEDILRTVQALRITVVERLERMPDSASLSAEPSIAVLVDSPAFLCGTENAAQEDARERFSRIARESRSAGVHLVCATQQANNLPHGFDRFTPVMVGGTSPKEMRALFGGVVMHGNMPVRQGQLVARIDKRIVTGKVSHAPGHLAQTSLPPNGAGSATDRTNEQIVQASPTLKAAVLSAVAPGAKTDAEAVRNYRSARDHIVRALPALRAHFATEFASNQTHNSGSLSSEGARS